MPRKAVESVQARISPERIESREFGRITNKIPSRGKSLVLSIINGPEVISSSSDKAKLFAGIFAANSTLDDSNHPLPDFPSRTNCTIPKFKVTLKVISKLIHYLQSSKATCPDQIPVVVFKHISTELSPMLAKLFNRCLQGEMFSMFFEDIYHLSSFQKLWRAIWCNKIPANKSLEHHQ